MKPESIKIFDDKPERVKVADVVVYEKNAKEHHPEQVLRIAKSINTFGWRGNPVLLNSRKDNVIVCGHGRLLAAKDLNMSEIPCVFAEDMSDSQVKAFRIADNKVAESEWNKGLLIQELSDLQEIDFELDLTGFNDIELGVLLELPEDKEEKDFPKNTLDVDMTREVTCPSCGEIIQINKK